MNTTTTTMQTREAKNITNKLETLRNNYHNALTNGKAREAYNIMVKSINLNNELQAVYDFSIIKDAGQGIATSITIHSLQVLARGRSYTDKEGNKQFTPCNVQAMQLLEKGKHDTTGIIEDLTQSVYLVIWEAVQANKLTIGKRTLDNGKEIDALILTDESDDSTMRSILNVVQSEFYQNQQKHYKHEYRPTIDDEGNEDTVMISAAMREYEKREYIQSDDLFDELSITLTEVERAVLNSKKETKQVERAYSNHGVSTMRYVTRYKTLEEVSADTGYTVMQVRTALKNIQKECQKFLANR